MGWVVFVIIPLGLIIMSAVAVFILKSNKKIAKIDVNPNADFVLNPCRKKFTEGYGFGRLKDKRENKNGTTLVEYYPMDIEEGEFAIIPKIQKVVVLTEDIEPDMGFSQRRDMLFLNSRDPSRYPKTMQDNLFGEWATVAAQKSFLKKSFRYGLITSGDEAIAEAQKDFARGNITRNALEKLKEENNILRKMKLTIDGDKERTKSD